MKYNPRSRTAKQNMSFAFIECRAAFFLLGPNLKPAESNSGMRLGCNAGVLACEFPGRLAPRFVSFVRRDTARSRRRGRLRYITRQTHTNSASSGFFAAQLFSSGSRINWNPG